MLFVCPGFKGSLFFNRKNRQRQVHHFSTTEHLHNILVGANKYRILIIMLFMAAVDAMALKRIYPGFISAITLLQ